MSRRSASLALVGVCLAGVHAWATPFTYRTYDDVAADLQALAQQYPDLTRLTTAQAEYGLPPDGPNGQYEHFILRIANEATGLDKPELLIVGTQHGDEVVGVEVAVETARLLLERYGADPWLTALVDQREIYFMPLANPQGFVEGRRSSPGAEGNEDMNRDHIYDRDCDFFCDDDVPLSTVGGRALWELSRRHAFRVMLDYHGGIELIIHPWGTPIHRVNTESPDERAANALGSLMSEYGGPFRGFYPVGTSNDLLGPVIGPLDDSSYAPGWDPANADSQFPNDAARAISYTVEISNQKRPPESLLGGDADLLTPGGTEDGYIPKNVRIALAAIDLTDPFVEWTNRDQVPTSIPAGEAFEVRWQVRGCFEVDETRVRWGFTPEPRTDFIAQSAAQSDGGGEACFEPPREFTANVSIDVPGTYFLTPVAKVDESLTQQGNPAPDLPPQSFFVRARTEEGLIFANDVDPDEISTVQGQIFRAAQALEIEVTEGAGGRYTLAAPVPGEAGVENTFAVSNATPGQRSLLLAGVVGGSTPVPGCPGVEADISNFRILASAIAEGDGTAELTRFLPAGLSGRTLRLQAVERPSCTLSEVVLETF
ncbi:MAG: M14 family metallopeptidase [Pseudomonadota bacterium]